ncbi:ATP-binding protein [bacterium]|nr:ATP-binding protein [bacterium]MDB4657534.1 ATP-binding protein [Verrucomicrobiales bacterium]MDC0275779.1 ATP-binding protein [Verrucomicrobiales bacterium]
MGSAEQIKSINHHLRHAIEQVSEGILIIDTDTDQPMGPKIVFANRAAGVLSGWDPESLNGKPIGIIYDPEFLNDLIARLPQVAATNKTFQMEKKIVRNDGKQIPLRWTISAVTTSEGGTANYTMTIRHLPQVAPAVESHHQPPTLAVEGINDISQNLEISRVESLALLVGGTAHDFRNALQAIRTKLTLAHLDCPLENPARKHIEDAEDATQHAHSLAQKILDFTKGKESTIEVVNLTPMLTEVANISTMGTSVRCEVASVENLRSVKVETLQVQQVFHNLMINASQAMPNGGVIQVTAQNVDAPEGNELGLPIGPYVMISVRDRGQGIPDEAIPHIFGSSFTTKKNGTGIGLATCKAIVERHAGAITVSSRVNVGTEFKVLIPAYTGSEAAVTDRGMKPANSGAAKFQITRGHGRVLVVDDTDSVREAAVQLLAHLGYDTVSASNGQQAVQMYCDSALSTEPINAVLLDMTLPGGLSGKEVMAEIRKFDDYARVIATSGYFDDDAEELLTNDGWAGVLPKPYAVEDLSSTLAKAMQN